MQIAMTDVERTLFESLLRCSRGYVEFGTGGSTLAAASLVRESIISVDSSAAWIERVRQACTEQCVPVQPTLVTANVGETGDWGWPTDPTKREDWPNYHTAIWSVPGATHADLFLVDGRFRVACFMQAMIRCDLGALLAIHDFAIRPHYHAILPFVREIARAENLSVFLRREDYDRQGADDVISKHIYEPA